MLKKTLIFLPLYCVWVGIAGYLIFGKCTACLDPGPLQLASIGGYLVVILIPIWPFVKWFNAVPGWVKKVEANGKQASASILDLRETGMVINNTVTVIKLQLRVEPPGEAPFEVNLEKEISMLADLGRYSVGAHLNVKYDPDNRKHVVILSDTAPASSYRAKTGSAGAPANPGSDVTGKLEELSKLHKSGELSDSEYAAAKKKLLG